MTTEDTLSQIQALPIWQGDICAEPLAGGLTNVNYLVTDAGKRFVVRMGQDISEHHVVRANELAASRAAHLAGLSPAVVHAQTGITVLEFIESKTLSATDIQRPEMLARIVALIGKCHRDIPQFLRGPAPIFWVFHVIRDYGKRLKTGPGPYASMIPELLEIATQLEADAAPFDIVFGHNDLLAANFLDDGERLWLIDWDYAGFNTPLFDLGGLASNNGLGGDQETHMLELYIDAPVTAELRRRYDAMKCASLLRETMWSMVSELTSKLDVDFAPYTSENLVRFRKAYDVFRQT